MPGRTGVEKMLESEAQRKLHELFHPLMHSAVQTIHILLHELIEEKRAHGWRSDFTRRLDGVGQKLAERFAAADPQLGEEVRGTSDLICVLSDLERELFPRWFEWLIEELVTKEIIFYDGRELKIKVKVK